MNTSHIPFVFEQIHIDVARNATDDFNLFHEPVKWQQIDNNPFAGPIVLGFQLESLLESRIKQFRLDNGETALLEQYGLRFSNYQFTFANAVKPGQFVEIDIKKSQFKADAEAPVLSNRVAVKSDGTLALTGYKKESQTPLYLADADFADFGNLRNFPDRSFLSGNGFFLKRKFMNVSNAKNFLCGSLIDQTLYFDDLEEKTVFPEIFVCSLVSCALLEKAWVEHHDFKKDPMVYAAHKISVDRDRLAQLKSNSCLHLLVKELEDEPFTYRCFGLIEDNRILFRAIIALMPLKQILNSQLFAETG